MRITRQLKAQKQTFHTIQQQVYSILQSYQMTKHVGHFKIRSKITQAHANWKNTLGVPGS